MTPLSLKLIASALLLSTVVAGHDGQHHGHHHHGHHRNGTRGGRLVPFGKPLAVENSTALAANMTVPLANSTTGLGGNETFVATGGNEEDEGEDCDVEGQGDDDDDLPDCDADEEIETASTSEKRWDWRSAYNQWRSTHSAQVPASTVAQPVSTSAQAPSPTVIAAPVVTSSAAPAPASASSAAAVNTPPPSTGGTSAEDIAAYLKAHNDFRAQYNAEPLVWNETLATYGKNWSSGCVWKHSAGKYGENLAAGTKLSIPAAIKMWNDEAPDYNKAVPNYSHFTQVVWKGSKQLGCGVASCPGLLGGSGAASFYTCEYYPPGNYLGQFSKNVEGTTCTNC